MTTNNKKRKRASLTKITDESGPEELIESKFYDRKFIRQWYESTLGNIIREVENIGEDSESGGDEEREEGIEEVESDVDLDAADAMASISTQKGSLGRGLTKRE